MFTVENRVGGLIEARVLSLADANEARAYSLALAAAVKACPAERTYLCADHRAVAIYPQVVADELSRLFVQMNTRLFRIAVVVSGTNATLTLQLGRIIREAKNPSRRLIDTHTEALAFLGEVFTEAELKRCQAFLGGHLADGTSVS